MMKHTHGSERWRWCDLLRTNVCTDDDISIPVMHVSERDQIKARPINWDHAPFSESAKFECSVRMVRICHTVWIISLGESKWPIVLRCPHYMAYRITSAGSNQTIKFSSTAHAIIVSQPSPVLPLNGSLALRGSRGSNPWVNQRTNRPPACSPVQPEALRGTDLCPSRDLHN